MTMEETLGVAAQPSVADVAVAYIKQLVQTVDLTTARGQRRVMQALKGLAVIQQAFAGSPEDEEDMMLAHRPRVFGLSGNIVGGIGDSLTGSFADPERDQGPNQVETFQSHIMREAVALGSDMASSLKAQVAARVAKARLDALDLELRATVAGQLDLAARVRSATEGATLPVEAALPHPEDDHAALGDSVVER